MLLPTPILATKLYIPDTRPNLVPRPRLIKQLTESFSSRGKLTLISAPAGFGKTTLVSSWLYRVAEELGSKGAEEKLTPAPPHPYTPARFAWLSLDESDGTTTLHGPVIDQAALHGILNGIRDLRLSLISVQRVDPDRKND